MDAGILTAEEFAEQKAEVLIAFRGSSDSGTAEISVSNRLMRPFTFGWPLAAERRRHSRLAFASVVEDVIERSGIRDDVKDLLRKQRAREAYEREQAKKQEAENLAMQVLPATRPPPGVSFGSDGC